MLAADSRVTLTFLTQPTPSSRPMMVPATFDNATKLLKIRGHENVGAVTYGLGAIGQKEPRTAHSFISEFEAQLGDGALTVEVFAQKISDFFLTQWNTYMAGVPLQPGLDLVFLVGGYDQGATYGKVFEVFIPSKPKPMERFSGPGEFGAIFGGQREIVDRLIRGYDQRVLDIISSDFGLNAAAKEALGNKLSSALTMPIPFQFLPLQDCVDLSIFLVRTTMKLQTWTIGVRGVGGAVDVATITKTDGFVPVQIKKIFGERQA